MSLARAVEGWRPYALLALLCLGLYLPGLAALPITDRDEARFAQATRQMFETGDFLRIRFQDEARNKKPAGIYWLQAAAVAALSNAKSGVIWPYRLPSLIGASAAVLFTFCFGARLVGREAALIGAALAASALGLVVEAHLATTDASLLASIVAAQGALGVIYATARRRGAVDARWALLFWLAEGAAILLKGPVAPLLAILTLLALGVADRDGRWLKELRPLWGVPLLLLIVGPWLVAISAATGGAFLGESIGHDFLGKLIGAQESHGAPPLYYTLLLPIAFWPSSLFLGPAAAWAWRARRDSAERFLIAWALPFWLLLELVPTKLPHYLLPIYPALALLAGRALTALGEAKLPRRRWLEIIVAALWVLASLLLAVVLVAAPMALGSGLAASGIVTAAVILFFGGRLLLDFRRRAGGGLAVRAALLALLVFAPALEFLTPRLDRLFLSRAAVEMVARHRPPAGTPIAAVGYAEPSLVFGLGTNTRLVSAETAAQSLTEARGAVALVESREDASFRQALARLGWEPRRVGSVAGLDYSNGRKMVLTLYAGAPG